MATLTTFMSHRDKLCVRIDNLYVRHQITPPELIYLSFEGVLFDELAAGFDLVTHQDTEQ